MRANMIYNPYNIYPGQLINIPINFNKSLTKEKAGLNAPPFCAKMVLSGLLILLSIPKYIYRAGDTITLNLFKINLSSQPIKLNYNTGQRYDLKIIYPTGKTLWRWSKNKSFIQALGTVTLDVGQSVVYNESFTLPINLPPGLYTVLGWNTAQQIQDFKLILPIYVTN